MSVTVASEIWILDHSHIMTDRPCGWITATTQKREMEQEDDRIYRNISSEAES
jgi:hypothetical protein